MFRRLLDRVTSGAALGGALSMIGLLAILIVVVVHGAVPAIRSFGLGFVAHSVWNPVTGKFGAWPVVYGTLVSSAIAVLLAVPISIGAAIFLVRLCPDRLVAPASFLVELLAAIPSITYGLWGAFVLVPWMQGGVQPALGATLGRLPAIGKLFENSGSGYSMLSASVILAIMITPIVTAVTRDLLRTAPKELELGAYGLGATWWQATRVVLSFVKIGVLGAVILGLARALGETMAVTMVIGNTMKAHASVLDSGQTIASMLAVQFAEADTNLYRSALIYGALLLLGITTLVNGLARVMVVRVAKRMPAR